MKTFIITMLMVLAATGLQAQQIIKETLYFDYDKYGLTASSAEKLDSLLAQLKGKNPEKIKVSAHTDGDGSDGYNETLSQNRALTVADYLAKNGVDRSKIKTGCFGEKKPVADNGAEPGKQQNRRVELVIELPALRVPKAFTVAYRTYQIKPGADTTLRLTANGSKVHIPENCFVDKHGRPVKEAVTLQFREFTNQAEIAFSGIPMTYKADGTEYNFNSSGMFEIKGSVNGEDVYIAQGKSLTFDYALARKNPDIGFFALDKETNDWKKIEDIQPAPKADVKVKQEICVVGMIAVDVDKAGNLIWLGDGNYTLPDNGDRKSATLLAEGSNAGHTYPDIIKGLSADKFGVYNCDQIYRLGNRVNVTAKYVDAKGQEIKDTHVLSLIDMKYNGAFSFDPKQFTCDAAGQNVLALFTKKGELYLLDKTGFDDMHIDKSGSYVFKMKNMSATIKNSKDLANYLGLKS